jgi:hypothetical protein
MTVASNKTAYLMLDDFIAATDAGSGDRVADAERFKYPAGLIAVGDRRG